MPVRVRTICLALFTMVATIMVPVVRADSVVYSFSGTNTAPGGDALSVAFVYTSPGFITSLTSVLPSQLNSCENCLVTIPVAIPAVFFQPNNVFGDSVDFNDSLFSQPTYMFPFGSLITPGAYFSGTPFNPGTLTVTVVPSTSTPEPSSLLLLALGLCSFGWLATRKLRREIAV